MYVNDRTSLARRAQTYSTKKADLMRYAMKQKLRTRAPEKTVILMVEGAGIVPAGD